MRSLAIVIWLVPVVALADIPPAANALFDKGIADMKDGKYEDACKELAESLKLYDDSGTKGALATCYTRWGKIASGWTLWRELAETETDAARRQAAADQVAALDARLPHYQLHLAAPPVPGFVLKINTTTVPDPTIAVPLPVDPGVVLVEATAPDYKGWSNTVTATEQQLVTIEVPALVALPKAPTTGTLHVTSSAPNATVRVDGKAYGTTPVDVELDGSSHTLEVAASGYNTRREAVGVTAGQKRDFVVVLDKIVVVAPAAPPERHFYQKWSFWVPVALVVIGGAATAYALTTRPAPIEGTLAPGAGGVQ